MELLLTIFMHCKRGHKAIIRNSTRIPSIAAKLSITFTFLSIILIPVTIVLKLYFGKVWAWHSINNNSSFAN